VSRFLFAKWSGFCNFAKNEVAMQQYELNLDVETKEPAPRRRRSRASVQTSASKTSRQEHVYKRNRELIARYYYWTEIRRRRFDDVMRILSEEFHVEDRTVSNALLDFGDYLAGLYKGKKDVREFKREYPGRNWEC
jgi:hypothetical protein